jgi:hypothetical protein
MRSVGEVALLGGVLLLRASLAWADPAPGNATAAFPEPSPAPPPSPTPSAPPTAGPPTAGPPTAGSPGTAAPPPVGPPPSTYYAPPSAAPSAAPAGPYYETPRTGPPPEVASPKQVRRVSLTFSPLHLIEPAFIATVEVRPTDHLGLAVFGGFGSDSISVPSSTEISANGDFAVRPAYSVRVSFQEIGGQVVAYPLQEFDSLEVGLQLLYLHLSGDFPQSSASGAGAGTALGPFVGYKLITSGGFTLVVQGGAQYLWVNASATNTTDGTTSTASDHRVLPMLNFTLGWSF